MHWLVPGKLWLAAPSLEQDEDFRSAVAWARDFTPEPEKEAYGIALDFAKRKYDLAVNHIDTLDKKADEIIRTSVTIAALLVGAIKALEVQVTVWLICSFLSFTGAIILAAIGRRPYIQVTPGSIMEVLGFIEDFRIKDRWQIEALLAASYRCAIVGTRLSSRWKADQVMRATVFFIVGVISLLSVFA